MRIGIDARCFASGKTTGIEEYTKNFLKAVFEQNNELKNPHTFILFFNSYKEVAIDWSWLNDYKNVRVITKRYPNKILNFLLWYFHYPKIDKLLGGVDLYFMPNPNFVALSSDAPLILTMHDLSHEHYRSTFSLKRRLWHFAVNPRALCDKATKIFCVSESTKNDLKNHYNLQVNKIDVLLSGPTDHNKDINRNSSEVIGVMRKYKLPYKFILFFGTIEPRKNILGTVKAYVSLRESDKKLSHKLILAGARGWNESKLHEEIKASKYKDDIVIIHDLSQKEREALYVLADVFIYPSFFEGFGFPPLEAIMANTPVITSHSSSLPEVVKQRAIMIDPSRYEEIVSAMKCAITDKALRADLSDEGENNQHLEKFSWNIAARKFLQSAKIIGEKRE